MPLIPKSLRARLAILAVAGLVLTGLLAVLLLQTSHAAYDVVRRAHESHERMRAFSRLAYAGDRLQTVTYDAVRSGDPKSYRPQQAARAEFIAALAGVGALPAADARQRRVAAAVHQQGERVLALFSEGSEIVRRVDAQWRTAGSRAALREVQDLSRPYVLFNRTVTGEITAGDAQIGDATRRSLSLQRLVSAAALISLVLGLALSAAIFLVLLTRLGPGLKRLEQGALAFGRGDLGHRIGLSGDDELKQLSTLFDSMAQQLAEKQAALREVTTGLERAVAARTAELEQANAALSAEDERLRAFLADVSHELRTPLTIIRGEVQVALRAQDRMAVDPADVYERILQQTRGLSRLVNDLFLIARAEAGGLRLDLQEVDVSRLAVGVAHDFSTLACEQGATVRARPSPPVFALCDPDRVRQALAALIDNALRHTRPEVNILVETAEEAGSVLLKVSDDGPGIDPSIAGALFGRFRRGATRGEGSGLGLTVVRALALAQGGDAWLDSAATGGARAVVRLPGCAAPASVAAAPAPASSPVHQILSAQLLATQIMAAQIGAGG